MKTINLLFSLTAIFLCPFVSSAGGEIKIQVIDYDGEPAIIAQVLLISEGDSIDKKVPDVNGMLKFTDLQPGNYDIKITMMNCVTHIRKNVYVTNDKTTYITVKLKQKTNLLPYIEIHPDVQSVVQKDMIMGTSMNDQQIKLNPSDKGNVIDLILSITPCATPTDDGKDIYIKGARKGTTQYMIDGDKVIGSLSIPSLSIGGLKVYTGGIPAMYGDLTGGLVILETKTYIQGIKSKKMMQQQILKENEDNSTNSDTEEIEQN